MGLLRAPVFGVPIFRRKLFLDINLRFGEEQTLLLVRTPDSSHARSSWKLALACIVLINSIRALIFWWETREWRPKPLSQWIVLRFSDIADAHGLWVIRYNREPYICSTCRRTSLMVWKPSCVVSNVINLTAAKKGSSKCLIWRPLEE